MAKKWPNGQTILFLAKIKFQKRPNGNPVSKSHAHKKGWIGSVPRLLSDDHISDNHISYDHISDDHISDVQISDKSMDIHFSRQEHRLTMFLTRAYAIHFFRQEHKPTIFPTHIAGVQGAAAPWIALKIISWGFQRGARGGAPWIIKIIDSLRIPAGVRGQQPPVRKHL